ncbi:MAG: hypothetical protein LQ352_006004 [Teloschistes flavicans]|nr:MAG: hypothetical protein LQ352_006004 [Teloschistes flavicans]
MPVLAYCICWTFMTILIAACVCRPFALNWNSKLKGHCGDRNAAYIAISALDIIGDALICVLPMPMIWRLRTSTSTKFGLSAVFTLGFLNIIVAILRIIYLVKLHNTSDYTWDAVKCWIWSVLEPGLAVLVACAPTLQPVIAVAMGRRIFPKAAHLDNHTSYPSYPERHQQFSNISDTDYPLRPVYGNISHANSNSGKPSRINSTSSRRGDGNYETRQKDSDVIDYQQTGIRVQKDITVKRALIG